MDYTTFTKIFPKIAEKETRILHVFKDEHVPIGEYGFLPAYCMDKTCDCRRALINVIQVGDDKKIFHAATISYGWENMDFYINWSFGQDDEMLKEFKGPALDMMQRQSEYAPFFLDFFKNVLIKDEAYFNRIKRHYAYVKMKQFKSLPKDLNRLIDYFGECPCESGKIFRLCCGKKKRFFR